MCSQRIRTLAVVGLIILVVAMLLSPERRVAYADDQPVKLTVKVTDVGFEPDKVEVVQGAAVELTFVWANPAHPDDEHIMVVAGYNLESDKIDSKHNEATVKFVATQSGSFNFKCNLECDVHANLQHGELIVKPSGGSTAALQPSKLVIKPESIETARDGTMSVTTVLEDKDGAPIPKVEVQFLTERTFLKKSGVVEIGAVKTDSKGEAALSYRPTVAGAVVVFAKFAGGGIYAASEQTIQLGTADQSALAQASPPDDSLHGFKGSARFAFVGVIGFVWATFGFIGLQVWRIRSFGRRGGSLPH